METTKTQYTSEVKYPIQEDLYFLSEDPRKPILTDYNKRAEVYKNGFEGPEILEVLTANPTEVVRGSNTFSTVLLDETLENYGFRIARHSEFSNILMQKPQQLKTGYFDTGVVLREISGANQVIAEDLIDQILEMYGELRLPSLISLSGLRLIEHPGSNYNGLSLKVTRDTEIIYAPVLNDPGFFSLEDLDPKTALPKKTRKKRKKQDLELLANSEGLSRFYINLYLDFNADFANLADSYTGGKTIVRKI